MSSLQQLFTSRKPYDATTFVAGKGKLFYNELTGQIRLGDGVTPGGQSIAVTTNIVTTENILPDADNIYGIGTSTLRWNHLHLGDGGIYFDGDTYPAPQTVPYLPGAVVADIIPAPTDNSLSLGSSTHRWGDVWIGRASIHLLDETTNADVALTVDNGTMYLNNVQSLAVGQLTIVGTTLTSQTSNLDISIGATDDTGFFYVKRKAQFDNTSFSSTEPMVSFNASGGADPTTIFPDTVMQTVSRPNKNSRIIQRAYGSTSTQGGNNSYAVWGSYAARGSIASPQALKQNDILMRVSGNGYGVSTWGSGGARMEYVALEDFTDSAKGTKINFWTTPAGQLTSQNVASINSVGIVAAGVEFSATGRVQTDAGIPITAKAISSATYVATLGIDGKLDTSQIPSALSGAIVFKGGWDANANSPSLANGSGTDGFEYSITVSGTRSLGTQTGSVSYQAGGFVIYGNGIWNYTPPVSNFTYAIATAGSHVKVNGNYSTQETGVITLTTDATPNATTSTIVSRDASGNFAANVITASLTGNVTGNVSGNAGSVTNGVYTTGDQIIGGTKTFTSTINGTITTATYATTFNTSTLVANAVTAGYATTFNTSTLVANAVTAGTANKVANALTAGFGLQLESGTTYDGSAAHTVSALHGVTGPVSVVANAYALDLGAANGMVILNNASQANYTITISNPVVGKVVRVMNLNMKTGAGGNTVTVSGLTAANSTNGNASFQGNSNGAVAIVEFYCTTTATSGVYMNTGGAK